MIVICYCFFFFFNDTATTEIYTLSLHDALPICAHDRARRPQRRGGNAGQRDGPRRRALHRSEEHTSELQSQSNLVCRLLLEKKKRTTTQSLQADTTQTKAGTPNLRQLTTRPHDI